jgi:hypothetical protein
MACQKKKTSVAMGKYSPVDCTYVRSGIYADMNAAEIARKLGLSDTTIYLKKTLEEDLNRYIYLKFDISGFDFDEDKYLHVFFGNVEQNGSDIPSFSVYVVDNDWTAETMTWNRAQTGTLCAGNVLVGFDMTDVAKEARQKGEKFVSFRIESDQVMWGETKLENPMTTGKGPYVEYGSLSSGQEYTVKLSEDEELNRTIWQNAEEIADAWFHGGKDKVYAGGKDDVFELEKLNISKPFGDHTVLVEGCATGNPPRPGFRPYYARTIDTMIEKSGYVEGKVPLTEYDLYGGIANAGFKGEATGFFHTEKHGLRTYIIDPAGNPFFAVGVNFMRPGTTKGYKAEMIKRFGTEENFWNEMTALMRGNGINTATLTSEAASKTATPMARIVSIPGISGYMRTLKLGTSTGGSSTFANNNTMNVFDPQFVEYVETECKPILEENRDDPYVLGYTLGNELPTEVNMLDNYLTVDPTNPVTVYSYSTAWKWLEKRTGKARPSLLDLKLEYREEFKAFVYGRMFETVAAVKNRYDKNHMCIGTRAHSGNRTSEGYLRAAGAYCDVLTINMYGGIHPSEDIMSTIYRYSGKPFMVTEFYAKAQDAIDFNGQLLANQQNAGWLVRTQKDRGNYYENYTTLMLESKYCVGWVWYRFLDNDQSLYANGDGKSILRCYKKGERYSVAQFIDQDGNIVDAKGDEYKTWEGEVDTSDLGSNKGVVNVHYEGYAPVLGAFKRIGENLMGLVRFFDKE